MARAKTKWPEIRDNLDKIEKWAKDGIYEKDMAHLLGMSEKTWYEYKKRPDEGSLMKEALKKGRRILITDLKMSLYKKAQGFEHEETKVTLEQQPNGTEKRKVEKTTKYYAPDTGALVFALTNLTQRDDEIFVNRQDVYKEVKSKSKVDLTGISLKDLLSVASNEEEDD